MSSKPAPRDLLPDSAFEIESCLRPGHRTILLDPSTGMMLVDIVDDAIRHVELVDRPEIHTQLRALDTRKQG